MSSSFLLMVGDDGDRRMRIASDLVVSKGFRTAYSGPDAALLVDPTTSVIGLDGDGVVIGSLFCLGSPGPLRTLSTETRRLIVASRGRHLIDRYWGGYVGLLQSDNHTQVVRAPFGNLPCLRVADDGLVAFASDLQLLIAAGLYTPRLDAAGLARHLAAGDIRRTDTCLAGVSELRGGTGWSSGEGDNTLWSPWAFTGTEKSLAVPGEAEKRLRDVARTCVAAQTPPDAITALLLSGGLDSSIVAACLAHADRPFAGLTFATENPSGDERPFARAVATHVGARLIEHGCPISDIDLTLSAARYLPRPVGRSFEQSIDRSWRAEATVLAAAMAVDGGAGDNIFCALQSALPAADCLIDRAGRSDFWRTSRSIAEMTGASVLEVAWRAWRRARSPRPYRRAADLSFLSSGAIDDAPDALDHPWLVAPAGTLPGKTAHVALLLGAQGVAEDGTPSDQLHHHSVLIAQPLIETCLRIPSWQWFDRGCNRAAARRAFAQDLPVQVAWRRTKGSPDSLLVQVFEQNRATIRAMLSDGILATLDVIDVPTVLARLDDPTPFKDSAFARILQLVDAEAWARGWGH